MARLPYLDRTDVKPEHQDLLTRNINLYRALVHSPDGARAFSALGHFIRHTSRLDPRLREMAILQVGYLARSPYEYSHHVEIGRDFGVSDDDIRAVGDETAGRPTKLEPVAKAVLRAAREMTTDLAISDATFAELRRELDYERLTDLVLTVGFYNGVVRILATLQIDVEDGYRNISTSFHCRRIERALSSSCGGAPQGASRTMRARKSIGRRPSFEAVSGILTMSNSAIFFVPERAFLRSRDAFMRPGLSLSFRAHPQEGWAERRQAHLFCCRACEARHPRW
jgi:alkylhydroperoxidase family enzyme